jgi:hypothetical protein
MSVSEHSSSRGILIGAAATVVAAIIVSVGSIVAASRNRESLEEKIVVLQKRLDQAVKERDEAIKRFRQPVPPPPEPVPDRETPRRPSEVISTASLKGFDIALYGCVKDGGGKVTCFISVTNNEAEREIKLLAEPTYDYSSRAVDDARRELRAEGAEIGSKEGRQPEVSIPSGSALDGTISFNVPASSRSFTVLQVGFEYEYHSYKAEFRNVALTLADGSG